MRRPRGAHQPGGWRTAVALGAFGALAFALRALGWEYAFVGGEHVVFYIGDPSYRVDRALANRVRRAPRRGSRRCDRYPLPVRAVGGWRVRTEQGRLRLEVTEEAVRTGAAVGPPGRDCGLPAGTLPNGT